jgi:hypothetical protein
MNDIHELRPARPEVEDERPAYMPKIAWKWIVGVGGFLVLSYGVHTIRERHEADLLRADLLKARNTELAPVVARYESITSKVRRHAAEAARVPVPTTYVDPRLKLDALGAGPGLYLRLDADQLALASKLDEADLDLAPDAIGRCLGLAPASAGELLARGSFLEPAWIKQAEEASGLMRLRVVAEELRQRSERDLPFVLEAIKAQWFMLVLERGMNRREGPVDVYLWDLRDDQLLLRTRTQPDGALVSARIAVAGAKPGQYASGAQTGAAQDCSIASQLRSLTGGGAAEFTAAPPAPQQAVQSASADLAAPTGKPAIQGGGPSAPAAPSPPATAPTK